MVELCRGLGHGSNPARNVYFLQINHRSMNQQEEIANTLKSCSAQAQASIELDPSIDVYYNRFKSNDWFIYIPSRRSSGLSGLKGGKRKEVRRANLTKI